MAENRNYIGIAMGLDVTELKAGIKEANKQIQLANSEFNSAASAMDDWTKSTEGLSAKVKQLDTILNSQKSKLAGLTAEYEKVAKEQGEGSEAARNLKIQINNQQAIVNKTEKELKNYRETLDKAEDGTIDLENSTLKAGKAVEKLDEEAEKSEGGFTIMRGAMANLVAGGISAFIGACQEGLSSLMNLSQETQEYREDIGKLQTAWESAGKSTELATATYKEFYSVLGEEDRSVEAVNHLAKFVETEEDMAKWTDICAGVWGTFGDSLPIEGLTEASNETAKVGKITGVLADALNWAGKSEEEFQESLDKCNDEQERAELITETLNDLYKDASKHYKDNNKNIIAARKATSDYTDEMADLGATMEPVNTELTQLKTEFVKGFAPVVKNQVIPAIQNFIKELKNSGAITNFSDLIGKLANTLLPPLANVLSFVVNNFEPLATAVLAAATAFTTFNAAMAITKTITTATKAIGALEAGVGLATKAQTLWNAAMTANPIGAVTAAVGFLITGITLLVSSQDEATASTDLLTEAQRETVTAAQEAATAYRDQKAAADEVAAAETANIEYTQKLWSELKTLTDENGKVKEGYESRAEFILGQLNEALGTEYTMNGNIIKQYDDMKQSIEDVITAKKAQTLLTTYEETYKTAIENVAAAEKARATQAQELVLQSQKVKEAEDALKEARDNATYHMVQGTKTITDSSALAIEKARKNLETEEGLLAKKILKYDSTENSLYTYYQDIANYETASTLLLEGETDKAIGHLQRLSGGFQTVASTAKLGADEQKKVLEQQVIDTEVNAQLMKDAYEDGVEGVTEAMVTTAEEQARLAKEEFYAVGGEITKGIAEGAEDEEWTLSKSMKKIVDSAVKAAKKAGVIKSPSKLMRKEVGRWLGRGVGVGVLDSVPQVKKDITKFNDFVAENLGEVKGKIGEGIGAKLGTSRIINTQPTGGNKTVINAGLTVNYNGSLSRKKIKQLENDQYITIRRKLKAGGAV